MEGYPRRLVARRWPGSPSGTARTGGRAAGRVVLGMALTATASACAAPGPGGGPAIAVSTLFESAYCGVEAPRVAWLGDRHAVLEGLARARRSRDPTLEGLRQADFSTHAIVGIWMGSQPTGGYAVRLGQPAATIRDGELRLHLHWQTPAAEVVASQVLTSPCLLVIVPRGDYRRVRVVDERGRVRGEAAVP